MSGYKIVCWNEQASKWKGGISLNGKHYYCGSSSDPKLLAIEVNKKCLELGLPLKNPELSFDYVNPNAGYPNFRISKSSRKVKQLFYFNCFILTD